MTLRKRPVRRDEMSGCGTFRTWQPRQPMSGFRGKQPCQRNPETAEFDPTRTSAGELDLGNNRGSELLALDINE